MGINPELLKLARHNVGQQKVAFVPAGDPTMGGDPAAGGGVSIPASVVPLCMPYRHYLRYCWQHIAVARQA